MDRTSNASINIPGYGDLPAVDANPKTFFRRSTIAYGPSDTGKSVILKWIMELLQPYIPNVIVICPTDGANDGYKGVVPERCIFTDIDVKTLQDIWARQDGAVATYNRANDIDTLRSIFRKANDMNAISMAQRIDRISRASIENIQRDRRLNAAEKKEQTTAIEKKLTSTLRSIFKKTIRSYRDVLLRRRDLNDDEQYAIKYVDFNPSLLLIMDDCQAQIAEWIKDPTVAKLFYQGRHNWITTLFTMQSDTGKPGLPPGIRRNTFNSFFTDPNVAVSFFGNSANSFPSDMKRKATKCVNEIYKPNPHGIDNFKRLAYLRNDKVSQMRYILADEPTNLKMGSPALWRLCEGIPTDRQTTTNTKFSSCFGI